MIVSTTASATGDVAPAVTSQTVATPVAAQGTILPSQRSGVAYVQGPPSAGKISNASTVASPCTLYPSVVYLRSYGAYVGTKPYTICSVPVTSINHQTEIEKQSQLGYWEQVGPLFNTYNFNQSSLSPTSVEIQCKNQLMTNWDSFTKGTVVYQGVTFYAQIGAANGPIQLGCGT